MRRALGVALLVAAVVLAAGTAAFFRGVEISGEFLRPTLERALSAAFGLPTRLEGPLTLRTGLTATLAADALVIADPSAGEGATLGRGIRPSARIDLVALLRGSVALDEVTGERLELTLARRADGRTNWAPIFATSPGGGEASVTFDGIARLRIGRIVGSYRSEGADPVPFEIADFDGQLPRHAPVAVRGRFLSGGHAFAAELRTASLADFVSTKTTAPVQGAIEWSGLRATFDGEFARDGSRLDARVHATAADAGPPLAALGLAAREPGPLDARLRLNLAAGEATMRDLALRVGDISAVGDVGVTWAGTRPRVTARLAAERIDLRPYLVGAAPANGIGLEELIDGLQRIATGVDAESTLSATEIAGLAVDVREVAVEARSRDLTLDMTGTAQVAGVHVASSVSYDARQPRRKLAARIDSGEASTAAPGTGMPPKGWAGSVAALRGRLDATGTDARSIVASAQGEFEARDLRWSIDGSAQSRRIDRLRVSLRGDRAVAVDATGRIGAAACTLTLSGAALAPLLAGESWPVQGSGKCPGERFSARGSLALASGQPNADLVIDVAADRPGPIAGLLGVGQRLPYPLSARGTLALDASSVSVKFDALQLGRSSGAGDAEWPRSTAGAASARLAFTALDLDELGERTGSAPTPADPLRRQVLPAKLPLPDLDFEFTAERVAVRGETLRQARFAGALRSQWLPPAKFRFDWDGMTFAGQFGADFSGPAPRIEIEAATRDVDLRGWLARLGRTDIGLRAAALSLRAQAQGSRVAELLASATVDGALDRGRLVLPTAGGRSLASTVDFSATLAAAAGKRTRLTANGAADGEPFRLSLDAGALGELARGGESLPLTLAASSGDVRLEATGKIALDGSGEARLQLAGRRLQRLGALIGVALPAAEPYSARGNLRVTASAIDVDDLDLAIGRSRLVGSLQVGRAAAGRRSHRAVVRATALHLEDLGGDRWLHFDEEAPREQRATAQAIARATAWLLDILRGADFDLALEVESLLGAGQPLAAGRLTARADAGTLRLHIDEAFTAGGEINADVRVEAAATPPRFALKARARDLEYGPMLRALDPSTTLEGTLDVDMDLAARAPPEQVLRELAGTIDSATYPRGLRPRALNLWGVGLVNGLLRQLDPDSRSSIDCAVVGFDVERGVARSRAFFVNTTRVRIVGELEIDLVTRALAGRIDPRSKVPQLFAVAPTMLLGGTVENPSVSAAPRNIVTLPLRFAATLGGLLGDWRSGSGRADAGPAACREAFQLLQQADRAAR